MQKSFLHRPFERHRRHRIVGVHAPCESQAPLIPANSSDWPLLGRDEHASRFQPEPELCASEVPRLKLKWPFSMQSGGQPIVIGDWLFMTNRGGKFYALDAKSGCVRWAIPDGESRATAVVIRSAVAPSGWMALIGASRTRTIRALDAGGKIIWSTSAPHGPCHYAGDRSKDFAQGICVRAQSAAPSAMPGVVFSGTLDGWLRAYDTEKGGIVWQYSTTDQTYETVNGVHSQPGGGIDGMGPTIAGGMVYSMSGFNGASQTGSNGINVPLAFSVDGK